MEDEGNGTIDLLIYGRIGMFGIYADEVVAALEAARGKSVRVHINSPGGDVFEGIAIYNALLAYEGPVTTVVDGLAASAASFIALASDQATMMRTSQLMIHDAWGFSLGNARDMRAFADILDSISDSIADIYARKTGRPWEEWRDDMTAERWLSPRDALGLSLIDSITDPERGKAAPEDSATSEAEASAAAPEPPPDADTQSWTAAAHARAARARRLRVQRLAAATDTRTRERTR